MKSNKIKGIKQIFTEEVLDALNTGKPIVALESNVITHGLGYPHNIETALKVENAVRTGGSVPATIGIENGNILIGMTEKDIERFASFQSIPKVSSRDLPIVLAQKGCGATTVASTLLIADIVGISFFASAGIGGVHRGAETSMDISSDLVQLSRSKVAVVCAGAKNILDLNLTMEYLETQCVPLISYRFDDFPAFYCRSSGIKNPCRIDNELEIAGAIETHWQLGNNSSVLITSPIKEEDALDSSIVDKAVERAIATAKKGGIIGNRLTKYLMQEVNVATAGKAAKANAAVVISTAEIAGRLASVHADYLKNNL